MGRAVLAGGHTAQHPSSSSLTASSSSKNKREKATDNKHLQSHTSELTSLNSTLEIQL